MFLPAVKVALKNGGDVRFDWGHCSTKVDSENGRRLGAMDWRAYQGFLKTEAPFLTRTETGSTEEKNLIITWRVYERGSQAWLWISKSRRALHGRRRGRNALRQAAV